MCADTRIHTDSMHFNAAHASECLTYQTQSLPDPTMADLVGFNLFDDYLNKVQEIQQPAGAVMTCPTEQVSHRHGIVDVQSALTRLKVYMYTKAVHALPLGCWLHDYVTHVYSQL